MTTDPSPTREIVAELLDKDKQKVVDTITNCEEYKQLELFRQQIYFISKSSKQISKNLNDNKLRLTYSDIAHIFGINECSIKFHIQQAKRDLAMEKKHNGRPFVLQDDQILDVKKWFNKQKDPPKLSSLHNYVASTHSLNLTSHQVSTLIDKIGCETKEAVPMEESRYYCTNEKIDAYYKDIETFTYANNIPSAFVLNLDEEGNNEFQDAKKEKIIVDKGFTATKCVYPVSRNEDHATFLGCIAANGTSLKPLIIHQRTTVEIQLL